MCHPSFKLLCSYQLNLQNTVEFAERESQKKQWSHVGRVRSANQCWFFFSGPKSFCLSPGRNSLWPKLLRKKSLSPILSRNHGYTPKKILEYLSKKITIQQY
ncbi:hypothetical protein MG7_02831 [Candida albicans P34048]|nr:hypothetical protein MG7_02831 [Candida albicans P34048]KGU31879.1 hypothetical protein MGK_02769 [Candida albicans P57055]